MQSQRQRIWTWTPSERVLRDPRVCAGVHTYARIVSCAGTVYPYPCIYQWRFRFSPFVTTDNGVSYHLSQPFYIHFMGTVKLHGGDCTVSALRDIVKVACANRCIMKITFDDLVFINRIERFSHIRTSILETHEIQEGDSVIHDRHWSLFCRNKED